MQSDFFMYSCIRVALGPRVRLVAWKGALNPQVVYTTDHPKVVVSMLLLLCVALWLILFSPFSIAITSLR